MPYGIHEISRRAALVAGVMLLGWQVGVLPASATMIELDTQAGTVDITGAGGSALVDIDTSTVDTVGSGQTNASIQSNVANPGELFAGALQGGTADGFASADIVTGELKASMFTTTIGAFGQNGTSGAGTSTITEVFNVSGSGTLEVFMRLEGAYDVQTTSYPAGTPAANFQAQGTIELRHGSSGGGPFLGFDNVQYSPGTTSCLASTSCNGSIDDLLTFSTFLNALSVSQVRLSASVLAQMLTGAGFVDLGNTASLFIVTSGGLTLTPTDPLFLSNPAYLNAVPAPATLIVLGLGLVGLTLAGRRRR